MDIILTFLSGVPESTGLFAIGVILILAGVLLRKMLAAVKSRGPVQTPEFNERSLRLNHRSAAQLETSV